MSIQAVPVNPHDCYRQWYKAKDCQTVLCTSLQHPAWCAARASPNSAFQSRCGLRATLYTLPPTRCFGKWPPPASASAPGWKQCLLQPCQPQSCLRSLDAGWEGVVKVCGGWWRSQALAWQGEGNMWLEVDGLAGSVVWGQESWNTDGHPSLGRWRMNTCSQGRQVMLLLRMAMEKTITKFRMAQSDLPQICY